MRSFKEPTSSKNKIALFVIAEVLIIAITALLSILIFDAVKKATNPPIYPADTHIFISEEEAESFDGPKGFVPFLLGNADEYSGHLRHDGNNVVYKFYYSDIMRGVEHTSYDIFFGTTLKKEKGDIFDNADVMDMSGISVKTLYGEDASGSRIEFGFDYSGNAYYIRIDNPAPASKEDYIPALERLINELTK